MLKRVLVTGGAHRLGALLCTQFAQAGWEVWCHYQRSADAAEALCAKLRTQGHAAHAIQADLGQEDSEAALRRYVEKQFYLVAPDGKRLRLNWVGMKVNADNVVIFQEIEHTRLAPGTRIHNQLLTDFLPGQRNTLNVQDGGKIQTLMFDSRNAELPIR